MATAKRQPKQTLNKRQLRFLKEFPKDLNATQAAIRAGYSTRTANEQGSRLFKTLKAHIQATTAGQKATDVSPSVSVSSPRSGHS